MPLLRELAFVGGFSVAVVWLAGLLSGLWVRWIYQRPAMPHTVSDSDRQATPAAVPDSPRTAPGPRLGAVPPGRPLYAPRHDGLIRVDPGGRIGILPANGVILGTLPRRQPDTRAEQLVPLVRPYLDAAASIR